MFGAQTVKKKADAKGSLLKAPIQRLHEATLDDAPKTTYAFHYNLRSSGPWTIGHAFLHFLLARS